MISLGSVGTGVDLYDIPSSVPASHGYKLNSFFSAQLQFAKHNSNPDTPTIQSGEGIIFETNDIK